MSHTPGPWRWVGHYLMQDCPAAYGGDGKETNPFSTPCGHPIADDGSACGEYNSLIDTDSPDAILIAAAPDLLNALTLLSAQVVDCSLLLDAPRFSGLKAAELAIAKAAGTP